MSIIKSFSVCDDNGEAGDMFYIKHNSSNLYGTKGIALVVYLLIIVREITLHGTIDIKNIFLNPYPDYVVLILMTLYAVTFVLFVNKQTVIIKAFDYAKSLIEVCERI